MSLNRRYIATLAGVAVATIAIGLVLKRRLRVEPASIVLATEAFALQQLSQEGQVRRMSTFLEERISAVGTFAEHVTETSASGLRWRVADSLISTSEDRPIFALTARGGDAMRVAPVATSDSLRGQWALIVARSPEGALISAAGIVGGRAQTMCGVHQNVSEYLIGVPLNDRLAGAGIFDLDGRLRGMVARCSGRLAALPVSMVVTLLAEDALGSADTRLFGAAVRPLDAATRAYFGADSGLLVTAVGRSTPAGRAGWLPGDLVVEVGTGPVGTTIARAALDSIERADTVRVVLLRSGRRVVSNVLGGRGPASSAGVPSLGIDIEMPNTTGARVARVDVGSPAYKAGLRPGDRLLRVDNAAITTPASAQRALDRVSRTGRPAFLTFERDTVRLGALALP